MASGADHISNLPEDVLHHILSLLPAQDAVRTCVLAQSWRDLWRSAPAVRVAGCKDWPGGIYAFCRFVDGLLRHRRRGSEHLTRLELAGVQGNVRVLDFSGCPSLEELKMEDCFVVSLDIHSPYLKHVRIKYCIFYSNYRTRLFFPNLVSFEFTTNVGRAPLLESTLQ